MTTAVETRGHLIGGEQVAARSGATFETVDPATAEPFATLAEGDAEDVDVAVRTARVELLRRLADEAHRHDESSRPRCLLLHAAGAGRRRRCDHAVELPPRDRVVEDRARARV